MEWTDGKTKNASTMGHDDLFCPCSMGYITVSSKNLHAS